MSAFAIGLDSMNLLEARVNGSVLMSGTEHFAVQELNPYSKARLQPDHSRAAMEYEAIQSAIKQAGARLTTVDAPPGCDDGVFTANWGLVHGNTAILSSLPAPRRAEEPHAKRVFEALGFRTVKAPYRFSGQGDALVCGGRLLVGSRYRTDERMHDFLAAQLDLDVIGLRTKPLRSRYGRAAKNKLTGWPDSFFYDLDLALAVIRSDLIAWCPDAFTAASRRRIDRLDVEKIDVGIEEAMRFGCNLFSTGSTVIMTLRAPRLHAELERRGIATVAIPVTELSKAGGSIRCTTLTLTSEQ